jgi:hypothetical protein
MSPAY